MNAILSRLFSKGIADATRAGEIIEQDAQSILDTMRAIHGGEARHWSVLIDHDVQMVLVSRHVFPEARRAA